MMYRIHRDETRYSPALKLAWNHVLPLMYVPIIDQDALSVWNLEHWLDRTFSPKALTAAVRKKDL